MEWFIFVPALTAHEAGGTALDSIASTVFDTVACSFCYASEIIVYTVSESDTALNCVVDEPDGCFDFWMSYGTQSAHVAVV
jgi:hypothetical protein